MRSRADFNVEKQEKMFALKHFDEDWEVDQPDGEWADDGSVGIVRDGRCFCFYNGQGKGELTEKDIPRIKKLVDAILNEA